MGRTYVVSDYHFHHGRYKTDERGILAFTDRPFDEIESMNETLFEQLRTTLTRNDTLYFLGDLYFGIGTNRKWMVDRWRELEYKAAYWVLGNHDEPTRCPDLAGMFTDVGYAFVLPWRKRQSIYLSHYPLDVPATDRYRLISIHGHAHGTGHSYPGRMDVGIDSLYAHREAFDPAYFYHPITLDTAVELALLDLPSAVPARKHPIFDVETQPADSSAV